VPDDFDPVQVDVLVALLEARGGEDVEASRCAMRVLQTLANSRNSPLRQQTPTAARLLWVLRESMNERTLSEGRWVHALANLLRALTARQKAEDAEETGPEQGADAQETPRAASVAEGPMPAPPREGEAPPLAAAPVAAVSAAERVEAEHRLSHLTYQLYRRTALMAVFRPEVGEQARLAHTELESLSSLQVEHLRVLQELDRLRKEVRAAGEARSNLEADHVALTDEVARLNRELQQLRRSAQGSDAPTGGAGEGSGAASGMVMGAEAGGPSAVSEVEQRYASYEAMKQPLGDDSLPLATDVVAAIQNYNAVMLQGTNLGRQNLRLVELVGDRQYGDAKAFVREFIQNSNDCR
jgi:hypothetical protein